MHFPSLPTAVLALALLSGVQAAASDEKPKEKPKVVKPCTVSGPTGAFYDLNSLQITLPEDGKKAAKGVRTEDWTARGWDYHDNKANFTLNICGAVVNATERKAFDGVNENSWKNVSAYYELDNKKYSIG